MPKISGNEIYFPPCDVMAHGRQALSTQAWRSSTAEEGGALRGREAAEAEARGRKTEGL